MRNLKFKFVLRNLLLLFVLACNVGCDQWSKNIARQELQEHRMVSTSFTPLTLVKVENTGAFLSFGESLPPAFKSVVLLMLPLLVMAYGLYHLLTQKQPGKTYAIGLCFVIGGGLGNLYDRLLYGSVTDFLHLNFGIFQTGIFNMGDVSIMVGMCLLFLHLFLNRNATREDKIEEEEGIDFV